jgi:DNA-directed RNA polymerase subunit A'
MLHYNPSEYDIEKIKFTVFSPETIRKMAVAKIDVPDTYDDDGYPIDGGLMDPRMGVVDPGLKCKTCGGSIKECHGHFGYIELVRPVIHVQFAKLIYTLLRGTCQKCHKIVLTKKGERPNKCPNCGAELEEVKFVKPTSYYLGKKELLPSEVREWLAGISNEDVRAFGIDPESSRPEWMVLTVLPVPPVTVRPSITLESGEKSEDDLTHKLVDIIRINQKLEANINAGAPQLIIEDLWQLLQYHVTTFFDNETPNIPPARHRSGRPLKTLARRLKGKEGRFRYNLSGKRVNFSARTVISPDPRISLSEVGVPQAVANELTVPIPITEWNLEYAKELIKRSEYPRAVYVVRSDGKRIKVTEQTREKILEEIKVGWVVERNLKDGDIVLFNRQPSLHRISMMAHTVKVLPGKTFRLNPVVCPPYNADFDGDEMNLHAIQTEEARAEAYELAKVEKQIISPRHGHAIIKPQEDHVSGIYFLTREDAEFTKDEAAKLLYLAGINELPKPDRGKNYSGRLIFSMLLPKDLNVSYTSKLGERVVIKNGELVKGAVESKGAEGEILEKIFLMKGPEYTRWFIDSLTKMALECLTMHGLSVSLRSYKLDPEARAEVNKLIEKMKREIENLITQYKNGTLERSPGLTLRETLESQIMAVCSKTRDAAGEIVEKSLGKENSSIIMAKIGSRGSLLNAIQMSALLGQQAVRNKRLKRGYTKRTLVFFKPGALTARERGFVANGFRKGLTPDEFFHHAMGGRESLVNTAIRTARSGYMQRRLINALQDLMVAEDLSVRDADGKIVQYIYGGDGKDPMLAKTELYDILPKEDDVDTV